MTIQDHTAVDSARPRSNRTLAAATALDRLCAALVVMIALGAGVFQFGPPWWMDRDPEYQSGAGSVRYQVHLPLPNESATRLLAAIAIQGGR